MSHPVVLALFDNPDVAGRTARALRELGLPRDRVSIVARTHDEEGALADAADASPGSEFEHSPSGSRFGELSGHLLAAIALVMPGIGPIVADGPLAAELGEAAGHLAGGLTKVLSRTGLTEGEAAEWTQRIEDGACLLGAHTDAAHLPGVRETMERGGAARVALGTWE